MLLEPPAEIFLGGGNDAPIPKELRQAAQEFSRDQLPQLREMIAQHCAGKDVLVFRTDQESDAYLSSLQEGLQG